MGKLSRRPNRRNRPKRVRYVAAGSALRVIIATQPKTHDAGVDLAGDVALTKAALLYADSVELVSAGAAMVAATGALESATTSDALEVLGSLDPATMSHLGGASVPDNWFQIVKGVMALDQLPPAARRAILGDHADEPQMIELLELVRGFSGPTEQLRSAAASVVDDSGLRELDEAFKMGLVTVKPVGIDQGSTDAMVAEYVEHIKHALQDPTVHALFDESTASMARALVREGHVEPNRLSLSHAREAAVGGGLVARLPSFPNANVHDILALRADLSALLGRYRRAVATLAGKLQLHVYDEESAIEIEGLWRSHVAPTLDELRDGLERHSFIKHLARQLGTNPLAVTTGVGSPAALWMGFQSITGIDSLLAALTASVPAAAAAGSLVVRAAVARGAAHETVRGNDLFYE